MKTWPIFVLVVVGLLVGGCGTTPDPEYADGVGGRPDWVDGPARKYPDADFLIGVGRASTRTAAENDAQAALAKRFHAHIRQESQDWMGHISEVSDTGQMTVEAMSIDQVTQVSTDYVLRGAQIAERWDEGPNVTHCLAVLERGPAARSLRSEISRLDAEIEAYVAEGDKADSPAAKFMRYSRAMELMQRRQALNAELRVVDPGGRGRPAPISWADLVAKFTEAQANIKIGLVIKGSQSPMFQTCLAEELTKQRIEILEGTSDVDLMVHGDLKHQKAGVVHGSVMVRATVNLRLTDVLNGNTIAAFTETMKAGRRELQPSVQLAMVKLCSETAPKLVRKIRTALSK